MTLKIHPSIALFMITWLLLLLLCNCRPIASDGPQPRGFDYIYQFGDSLSDTGNLMRESPSSFCSFRPYGETLGDNPTGRCSNGLLMIDYFAKAFNVPRLNPYLQRDADFTHGVNFAVAGATALDASRFPIAPTNSSLPIQLGWFRSHLNATCASSSDCKQKFERALFLVGEVGGNDYNYAFLAGQSIKDVQNMVPEVIQIIVNAVEEVIRHGARLVVVPGNFPIGCMPGYLNMFGSKDATYDDLGCLQDLNNFAEYHNNHLQQAIEKLQQKHSDVAIHYGNYYDGLRTIIRDASSLGFDRDAVFKPCCGNAPTQLCGSGKGVALCSDPAKRISWDGIHLTQEAYKHLADFLLSTIFQNHHH